MKLKFKIGNRIPLVKKLLIVEGITRAGKFLLANLLNGFPNIEPVQYHGLLEQIPFLEKFGLMDRRTAQELLQCEIDTHAYEMRIGRNLNHRLSDKSSIFNRLDSKLFLERAEKSDGDAAVAEFDKEKPSSLQILHELMPNIQIYFDTFPQLKVLGLQRSPAELVYSWHQRGHGHRWGTDPKVFQMTINSPRGPIPWFAAEWEKNYYELSEMDRIIMSITTLVHKGRAAYQKLSSKNKKNILSLRYEDILENPLAIVKQIGRFLKVKPSKDMPEILKREKLPNLSPHLNKNKKMEEIKKLASPKYFQALVKLEKEYRHEK